jgi:hypothetical protein
MGTVIITVAYFNNLSTPAQQTTQVMNYIPDDAAVILEMHNDKSFYDIFAGNKLFAAVIGQQQINDLETLRKQLLLNPLLEPYLDDQNIYFSLHPVIDEEPDWLITLAASKDFKISSLEQLVNRPESKTIIHDVQKRDITEYTIFLKSINKRFYLVHKGEHIFCGSFSKTVAEKAAAYNKSNKGAANFVLMSDRQNANSLANLYVNYASLSPLLEQYFAVKSTDMFKGLKSLPASAALTLNFRSDALMFNGTTTLQNNKVISYLGLFANQQPIANHLKDIFPSSMAYGTTFAVSDPAKFEKDLLSFQNIAGLESERKKLLSKVLAETGINIKPEFDKLLGNEFAIITTRYQEKIALIQLKNGSRLKPFMLNISASVNENEGQLKYEKLPFFLLGDAFSIFKKPWFRIADNYLVLANSNTEITSFLDSYTNRKFLSKLTDYNRFDDLLSEKSNVLFFFNFKNLQHVLKETLKPTPYHSFEQNNPGWKDFYGASYQFSAANKNFYTNFCIQLAQPDTSATNKAD